MKRFPFLTFFSICAANLPAQINITSGDFPSAGTNIKVIRADANGASVGSPGANQTYDFSMVQSNDTSVIDYFSASSTIFGQKHAGAQFATYNSDFDSSLNDSMRFYIFYKTDANAFMTIGATLIGNVDTTDPQVDTLHFNTSVDADTMLSVDYVYGYTDTERFFAKAVVNAFASVEHIEKRIVDVDGWGSLQTPLGTFNVLRIKVEKYQYDTLRLIFGSPIGLSADTSYYFEFWANNIKHPVLTAYTDKNWTAIDKIEYVNTQSLSSESYLYGNFAFVSVFPNPAGEYIYFMTGKLLPHETAFLTIYNSTGDEIFMEKYHYPSGNYFSVPTGSLAAGVYFYSFAAGEYPEERGKFIVLH